jgi:hypothetical protein
VFHCYQRNLSAGRIVNHAKASDIWNIHRWNADYGSISAYQVLIEKDPQILSAVKSFQQAKNLAAAVSK